MPPAPISPSLRATRTAAQTVRATAKRLHAGIEMLLTSTKVSSEREFSAQNIATAFARQTTAHIAVRCQNNLRIRGRNDSSASIG